MSEKELKNELMENQTAIFEASVNIDKTVSLLRYWLEEYGFNKAPEVAAAISWGTSSERDTHETNSAKWYMEYEEIFNFIDISFDYILKTQKILNSSLSRL